MEIAVASDVHLTHRYIKELDTTIRRSLDPYASIILNGDLWDRHLTSWEKFINTWGELLEWFKQKEVHFNEGNHDLLIWTKQPEVYSKSQAKQYKVESDGVIYHVEHGHRVIPHIDMRRPFLSRMAMAVSWLTPELAYSLYHAFHFGKRENRRMHEAFERTYAQTYANQCVVFVGSHTHTADLRYDHEGKLRFVNTGAMRKTQDATFAVISQAGICIKEAQTRQRFY